MDVGIKMLALLGLVAMGFLVAELVDSGSSDSTDGTSEPDNLSEESDVIIDESYRGEIESNLLDLVDDGELTADQSAALLEAIDFRSGPITVDTAGGDDVVLAGGGNDTIDAGDGEDLVFGGAGDDKIDLGAGDDISGVDARAVESEDDFLSFPELEDSTSLSGPDGEALIEGGDDRVFGGPGDDRISDSLGANFINGQQGDDVIVTVDVDSDQGTPDTVKGGFGFDTLIVDEGDRVETGRGFDTVTVDVFAGVEEGYDVVTITDFERGKDTLELEGGSALLLGPTPTEPGDLVGNPITVASLADGSGSVVSINGTPVVHVLGPADLTPEDIVLST